MPHAYDEFFNQVIREIRSLPAEEQHDALLRFTAWVLRSLDRVTIAKMRGEIDGALGRTAAGQDILNLVDGHMALREIEETFD